MVNANGDDRVVATAHHIISSLNSSQTEDMVRILSNFDDRFSRFSVSLPRGGDALPRGGDADRAFDDFDLDDIDCNDGSQAGSSTEQDADFPLQSAETRILQWNCASEESVPPSFLWADHRDQVSLYLDAVDSVQIFMKSFYPGLGSASFFQRAQNLLHSAMLRLEAEFVNLLDQHTGPTDPDWLFNLVSSRASLSTSIRNSMLVEGDVHEQGQNEHLTSETITMTEECTVEETAQARKLSDMAFGMLPSEVAYDLCKIATRMVCAGYDRECSHVYVSIRKPNLEESLQRLGQERLSFEDVQRMPWELLENEIGKWIQGIKSAVTVLFPSERRLCETIFSESPSLPSVCFNGVSKSGLMQLLTFVDAVAIGRRAPEKLFKILDMYEVLCDLLPSIEALFAGVPCAILMLDVTSILDRLGDAAWGIFREFEIAMQRESSKSPVPGGAIHPLARYVMNYMRFLSDYAETVNHLLTKRDDLPIGSSPSMLPDQSPLSAAILRLMELLEKNLDSKSKLYKDPALSCLFLMNNAHYIGQKVRDSEVRKLVGDEWIRKNNRKLQQYHTNYQRTAWTKALSFLKDEGISISGGSASGAARNILKEKFKNFNAAFEENVRTQCNWVVSEPQLCTELRVSISGMLLPAYRSFVGRFQNHLDAVRHRERYVKYTPEDLEAALNDLFEGSSSRRRSLPASGNGQ